MIHPDIAQILLQGIFELHLQFIPYLIPLVLIDHLINYA